MLFLLIVGAVFALAILVAFVVWLVKAGSRSGSGRSYYNSYVSPSSDYSSSSWLSSSSSSFSSSGSDYGSSSSSSGGGFDSGSSGGGGASSDF